MDKTILAFIEKLEIFKTKIKALHWDADSLSQHKLCDEIAESIAEFQDQVSEVEQSISGKLPKNLFRPDNQEFGEIGTLKEFVKSVIDHTNTFYKELQDKGDDYIGMRSDCESFLSDMQRKLYLVDFTMKEDMKRRIAEMVNESRPKNLANVDDVDKFIGRRPTTMKARINQIYKIVKKYGIDSRVYSDEHWQAIEDYYRAITSLGYDVELKPCADVRHADSIESDGGYSDYDENDHMPRSKQYYIKITSDDGMAIDGYIKCMAAGTVEDPFSRYDTCMVLWPKNNRSLGENKEMKQQMVVTEGELKEIIKEATMKVLSETPLNYDIDNFSGRWNKNTPDEELNPEDYLDNPYDAPNSWDDEDWIDGDKDMENEHSWNAFDRQAIAPGVEDYYNVMKTGVPGEIDKAISRRNRDNDWSEMELRNRDRMMNKWVNGEREPEQIGDSWEDIHYEGKEPVKITESDLKSIVSNTLAGIISELHVIKSTHGHRKKRSQLERMTPEERKQLRIKMGIEPGYNRKGEKIEEDIEIKPENKGKFNATKKRTGKSTEELKHSKNPLTRKRAVFAANAKKWNHKKNS